ncbi:LysM peptidoglycan-binding domain-containing protein [Aquincola sp. S2]|uniref:LysM peptidoglycan-binding domain-containing protein n=1 Tax=Pseudaquabacterium terrae TaxID=2732868 RepID=A0ABX2ENL4_9BURK|nr:LysM peptidoglycan-binding domain-containing protein [Aquabacterium terrae]NRF70236.1 LysM peptidoglycan-binding domain-containing protein [Aquabacterium terrae]
MLAASEIADWWDEQHRQSKKELERFVDDNPNLFGVMVAATVATAMDLGAGTVDALRFGEGAAEGGVAGFGKDALRLIALAGPLGRGAKLVQTAGNAGLARLIVDIGGRNCGWISGTQALRQTGTRAFAAVEDLARALGKPISELGGSHLAERVTLFRGLGARISALRPVKTLQDIAGMTRNDGAVTMFNIFGKRMGKKGLESVGHAVYAYRDWLGRLRILDRGGRAGKHGEVFESLGDLARKYGLQGEWALKEAAVMENLFAKYVGAVSAPVFAIDVYALAGVNKIERETVAQAFEVSKTIQRQGKKAVEQGGTYHVVAAGDWLSKLAQRYYQSIHKWPVIYEANRDVIGSNPNLIKPSQRLLIPKLPAVSGIK